MTRPTRAKLARDSARRSQSDERNRTMQLTHSDKSISAHEVKLGPAAQAAVDRRTANLGL